MARKFIYKHKRGLAEDWKVWLQTGGNKLENGEIAIIDSDPGDNPNHLRLLVGDGKEHPYEEMPKFAYAQEEGSSVVSPGYDYAEYFKWSDGNPNNEDRTGYFVTIVDNTRTIRKATSTDKILGIATKTASLVGNFSEDKRNDPSWSQIGLLGIIEAKHDGTCTENGYAMVNDNGEATLTSDAFGYKIVNVNDEAGTIEVVLGNDSDMISRIKAELNDLSGQIDTIDAITRGRATGHVFDTNEDLDTWLLDKDNASKLNLGDHLYIRATDVPDYWWDGESKQELEVQKVDLTGYVTKTDLPGEIISVGDTKYAVQANFVAHTDNKSNPHGVTAELIGVYTKTETDELLKTKADEEHSHNDAYYTESEIDAKIAEINQTIEDSFSEITGEVNLSLYETKADATAKLTEAKEYADSVANTVKSDLVNGADDAHNTLKKLGVLIDANQTAIEDLNLVIADKADAEHTHDDRYYTEAEIDSKISTINGALEDIVDGTTPVAVATHAHTPEELGAASKEHTHTLVSLGAAATATYTTTISTNWTADGSYYYQDVSVPGILSTDEPIVDVVMGNNNDTNVSNEARFAKIFRITTSNNSVRVWSKEEIDVSFSIKLKVVR